MCIFHTFCRCLLVTNEMSCKCVMIEFKTSREECLYNIYLKFLFQVRLNHQNMRCMVLKQTKYLSFFIVFIGQNCVTKMAVQHRIQIIVIVFCVQFVVCSFLIFLGLGALRHIYIFAFGRHFISISLTLKLYYQYM